MWHTQKPGGYRPKHQQGAALFMALVFLLIMTLLGVFAMNISRMENIMAGNNQFQAQALSNSELALREIEAVILSITADGKPGFPNFNRANEYYNAGEIDTATPDWNKIEHARTANGSRYVVEYEPVTWQGNSARWPGHERMVHLFRITTRTTSSRGAQRTTQLIYATDAAP
jgi:Tfp pilus assembly protein PilX